MFVRLNESADYRFSLHYLLKGVACNSLEGLLHINCLLGTGFEIWDVVLALTPSLCSFGCYLKHKGVDIVLRKTKHIECYLHYCSTLKAKHALRLQKPQLKKTPNNCATHSHGY